MLAYRHAFHAGNHGDVLKHLVLLATLDHLVAKPAPLSYVDTHAGAGGYALDSKYAQKTAEHVQGVSALLNWPGADDDPTVHAYLDAVRAFNGGGDRIEQYPGSPALAAMRLRDHDAMRLFELHPTDEKILASYLGQRDHTEVRLVDGFDALGRELPPRSRRGLVLIDPSYELKHDYARVVAALRLGLKRFATGTFIVWYPDVALIESRQLARRLTAAAAVAPKGWLHVSLTVMAPAKGAQQGFGMTGSGVVVVNPPYTLERQLRQALPTLAQALAPDGAGRWSVAVGGNATETQA